MTDLLEEILEIRETSMREQLKDLDFALSDATANVASLSDALKDYGNHPDAKATRQSKEYWDEFD